MFLVWHLNRFVGVYHRPTREVHIFPRTSRAARAKGVRAEAYGVDDPALAGIIDADLWGPVREEIELIEEVRFEP